MSHTPINKLLSLLTLIKKRASTIDNQNQSNKAHRLLKDSSMFSVTLFRTKSDQFSAYLFEVEEEIKQLSALMDMNKMDFTHSLLERIEAQLSALFNALNANDTAHKTASIRQSTFKQRGYQKAAKSILKTSHQMHQKLAEYHEFERRLMVMLEEKNVLLKLSTHEYTKQVSQEALTIHQRLGRCRQAISKLERQIELTEKND
jgi:primosomal replication protein N''